MASKSTAPESDDDQLPAQGRVLRCARCRHEITHDDARIEVDGRHEHFFVNPHGFDFQIACFADAPGVASVGAASSEFPWFSGMTWQLDCCRGCSEHIGWIFRSPRRVFHGLIRDRLLSDRQDD